MRIRSFILVMVMVALLSCNVTHTNEEVVQTSEKGFDTTALFKEYLSRTFGFQIPEKAHCYYFIAKAGCGECTKQLVQYTKSILNDVDTNYVTFISANNDYFNDKDFNKLYRDSFNYIDEYAFGITNVSLVYTAKNKVDSIVPLKWGDEHKIIQYLTKQ
ncbi:MAG TPA: hypothetical protein PKG63_05930 [Bacteroidales bacterium]|nr:hypothetical protein [Bacteroidales bacterium]